MTLNKRLAFIALLLSLQIIAGAAEYVPPPANKLLGNIREWGHVISPNGKYLAHIEEGQNVNMLTITDLSLLKTISRVSLNGRYGSNLKWLNDLDLIFENDGRIIAINMRGEDRRVLIDHVYDADSKNKEDREIRRWHVFSTLPDDREHILVSSARQKTDWKWTGIHKLNIYTGEKEDIQNGTDVEVDSWYTDIMGNLRAAKREKGSSSAYFLYRPGKGDDSLTPLTGKKSGLDFSSASNSTININVRIAGFELQHGFIYAEERVSGDRYRLVKYDPAEDHVVDVLLEDAFYDIDGIMRFNTRSKELIGISYLTDTRKSLWFDKNMQDYQRKIDTLRPDTTNDIYEWSPDFEYLLLRRFNSKGIDTIDIYATKSNTLTTISDRSRGLSEYTMAETRKIRYRARDGYTLEGFLTAPPRDERKGLPLVVLPLDKPWSDYQIGYSPEIQFFATRGYAVFRPNHRGATGRGRNHLAPDTQDLSALIQDDIADGVKSLVKDGAADSSRVFLLGEYYGGHMAILSAMRHPELYKAVVTRNAPLDLVKQYAQLEEGKYQVDLDFFHALLNNRKPSGKLLQQHSPRYLIKDIKTPLLAFHGKNNGVVEAKQAEDFRDTAEKLNNKDISVKLIDKEGHNDWDNNNDIYFLEKSLEFFEKTVKAKTP